MTTQALCDEIRPMTEPYFVKLHNRGLIQIEGEDRRAFLQNLVSNDMALLDSQPAVYACLLTPQGKFLHDFFVLDGGDVLLLDCEGGERARNLYNLFNLYRLRSKIKISVEETSPVYAVTGASPPPGFPDPRHPDMGWRTFVKPDGMEERPFSAWDERRLRLGIPDGSRDMVPEQSTLMDCAIDRFNGVSFKKGCYIGQELTARMHHRGLAKKHMYTVTGTALPPPGSDIVIDGKIAGDMRSSCGTVGLAMLKDEAYESLKKNGPLTIP